jgi:hypothetical protein
VSLVRAQVEEPDTKATDRDVGGFFYFSKLILFQELRPYHSSLYLKTQIIKLLSSSFHARGNKCASLITRKLLLIRL